MYIYITHNVHSSKVITKNWSCNARKEVGLLRLKGLTEHSEVAQYVTVLQDGTIYSVVDIISRNDDFRINRHAKKQGLFDES